MRRSNNPLIISPEAEDDSENLSLFYGTVKDENGHEFIDLDRVDHFLALLHETHCDIRDYPEHNSFYENPFRRRLFLNGKYLVIYRAFEDATIVYCVAHAKMRPEAIANSLESRVFGRDVTEDEPET